MLEPFNCLGGIKCMAMGDVRHQLEQAIDIGPAKQGLVGQGISWRGHDQGGLR